MLIKQKDDVVATIYHHYDGHPFWEGGVGEYLCKYFSDASNWDVDKLLENKGAGLGGDESYEFENPYARHSDVSFVYTIDMDKKEITYINTNFPGLRHLLYKL